MLRHRLLLVSFVAASLVVSGVLAQFGERCSLPTQGNLELILLQAVVSSGGEGDSISSIGIVEYHYTCLAVASQDMYRSASVAVMYNVNHTDMSIDRNLTTHFQIACSSNVFVSSGGNSALENDIPLSVFSVTTRRDCSTCQADPASTGVLDSVSNCIECRENCNMSGLGACNIQATLCCSAFQDDGSCTGSCPELFRIDSSRNYTCVCDNNCTNGGVREGVCSCNCAGTGFKGVNCSEDINECDMSPCEHGGTCSNSIGSFACACAAGYTGVRCEINIDECASNPCDNGATCHDGVNSFTCECVPGYTGPVCETDIDECASNPCQHGGTCTDKVNGYSCACVSSYTGSNCDLDVDECAGGRSPCEHNSPCTNEIGSYTCSCPPRWTGQNCDQCDIANCSMCGNTNEGANCLICEEGYRKLDPQGRVSDQRRLDEAPNKEVLLFLCVRDCDDRWCVDCPDRTQCQQCQNAFRVTDANRCTIRSSIPTSAIIAIFAALVAVVVLIAAVIGIVAFVWLVHYNRTAPIAYNPEKKDPGDIKKELVLTKISEI